MQRVPVHALLIVLIAVMLPSCGIKYHDLIPSEFCQGEVHAGSQAITKDYVRSCSVYEGFQTKGLFSALWLSECTLQAFVCRVAVRKGLNNVQQKELYDDLYATHLAGGTAFYVLADIRDNDLMNELQEKTAAWSVSLGMEGCTRLTPTLVKEVDLEPEIQRFFGSAYSHHKKSYLVTFRHPQIATILRNEAPRLHVHSPERSCVLDWNCPNQTKQAHNDDLYW